MVTVAMLISWTIRPHAQRRLVVLGDRGALFDSIARIDLLARSEATGVGDGTEASPGGPMRDIPGSVILVRGVQ